MTDTFQFEYTITVRKYGSIVRGVKFTRTDEGVTVHADDAELESVDLIAPDAYARFNEMLGADPGADIIDTVIAAVAAGKQAEVEDAVRETGKREFGWADWDSDFYGFGQAESTRKQPTPYNY